MRRTHLLKVLVAISLVLGLLVPSAATALSSTTVKLWIGNASMSVNGVQQLIDVQGTKPVIVAGRTLVPIRAVIEAFGGSAAWESSTRKVTVTLGKDSLSLWIDKPQASLNGIALAIDSANPAVVPVITNGRTMLPLRFVAESLGIDVQYDATTKMITLTYSIKEIVTPPVIYTLTVITVGNGMVTPATGTTYGYGTVVTLAATPAAGYTFSGWSGDLSFPPTNPPTITMTGNKTVTATFVLIPTHSLVTTATPAAGGSISRDPAQASYRTGTVVQLAAVPAAGYTFTGWSGDLSGTTNPTTITMDAAKAVAATFAITPPVVAGYSYSNPAPLNTVQTITVEGLSQTYTAEMSVKEVIRGAEAWSRLVSANKFNSPAPEGYEYILARIYFKLLDINEGQTYHLSVVYIPLISSSGLKYDTAMLVTPDPDLVGVDLYKGASIEGWGGYAVKKDDLMPKLAFGREYNGTGGIWFKAYAPAVEPTAPSASTSLSVSSHWNATAPGFPSMTVSWNAVAGATGYEVWVRAQGGTSALLESGKTPSVTFDSDHLPAGGRYVSGITYLFKVRTVAASGTSAFTDEAACTAASAAAPSGITSKDGLIQFLTANFGECNTALGPTRFTFSIIENTTIDSPYDYWILENYDTTFFYNLKYSNTITTEMNHKVCGELRQFQEKLARAAIAAMPSKKLYGCYYDSYYRYPSLQLDLVAFYYYTWVNYSPTSFMTRYEDARISGFSWWPNIDDQLER